MNRISDKLQKEAIIYLKAKDSKLAKIIDKTPPPVWKFSDNFFIELIESIVSQQLSTKAADAIFQRLKALSADSELTAEIVLRMEPQKMRDCGISWSKIGYIKNIADYTLTSGKMFEKFPDMPDEEIIAELLKIKGVGRWTAEMFLIFTMGRPDVFSYGDLGIRNAIQKLYNLKKETDQKLIIKISDNWKPYRSIACRYLWKSLELFS